MKRHHDIFSTATEKNDRRAVNAHAVSPAGDFLDNEVLEVAAGRDAWSKTLMILLTMCGKVGCSGPETGVPQSQTKDAKTPNTQPQSIEVGVESKASTQSAAIKLLERISESRVLISWSDPTSCRYGAQTWVLCVARCSGNCALSGVGIHPGEEVFRPVQRSRVSPINASAMILAKTMCEVI
ncbi:DUF3331 domain-containing protein [Paraburkholderia sp. MMS20-SJTN17]|uniref:DUF3331 domain-containing protein n=1 Tax=Paraburkholderia translucens TaxID=2886945 RepID=A0ABS8KJN5_9BURK|nr:DUF3331 domain-containing protein [Paraburkholderia sp. MMS20-SJTN17]MCC8404648.1 DUF3331 domain-containing protein [Paraburkholderia sp. MMS20-SJTN17]